MDETFFQPTEAWFSYVQKGIVIGVVLVIIIISFLVSIMLSNSRLKHDTETYLRELESNVEYFKMETENDFERRKYRHNYKNMSYVLEVHLRNGDMGQALETLHSFNKEFDELEKIEFDTGNDFANALLSGKQKLAAKQNAKIIFDGVIPKNYIEIRDLVVVLGNVLDNSIEACSKLDKEVHKTINVKSECGCGIMNLTISNPIAERVMIRGNHIETTKADKRLHGYGMYSLNDTVKKYDGELKLSSTDDMFTVDMTLYLKRECSEPLNKGFTLRGVSAKGGGEVYNN